MSVCDFVIIYWVLLLLLGIDWLWADCAIRAGRGGCPHCWGQRAAGHCRGGAQVIGASREPHQDQSVIQESINEGDTPHKQDLTGNLPGNLMQFVLN